MRRGRFAPSPSGELHLGNLSTALLAWLHMRSVGGEIWLRIEDLDPQRSKAAAADGMLRDLEWLGLTWDGPVWRQSQRADRYARALEALAAEHRLYPCWCSRAEVAQAAQAPHGLEGPVYPGTCRGAPRRVDRPPALRFEVPEGSITIEDGVHGRFTQDVAREVGDFVVRRADGVASYQLAVVVDDAEAGITDVLRGDDLLASAPRQILLARALGLPEVSYAHVPVLRGADGVRLSKRGGSLTARALRERGVRAEQLVGLLATWNGLGDGEAVRPEDLVKGFTLRRLAPCAPGELERDVEALARGRRSPRSPPR